jgi:hypothetical protein
MKHLHPDKLQVGDMLGITDLSPFANITRRRTWRDRSAYDMSLATHCAFVCDRGGGLLYASEMLPGGGPEMSELTKYDRPATSWLPHVCIVQRHPLLCDGDDGFELRTKLNDFMIRMHSFKVRYGFDELLRFAFPRWRDDIYTRICSQWIIEGLHAVGIPLPAGFPVTHNAAGDELPLISPADIQRWTALQTVEGAIS